MQHMFVTVAMHTGYGGIKHVEVSLPYIEVLVADSEGKYYMERKPPSDNDSGLRRSRGPTLRRLVRLALACDLAEQMGKQLRRRFDRSLQRQQQRGGMSASAPTTDMAERRREVR